MVKDSWERSLKTVGVKGVELEDGRLGEGLEVRVINECEVEEMENVGI